MGVSGIYQRRTDRGSTARAPWGGQAGRQRLPGAGAEAFQRGLTRSSFLNRPLSNLGAALAKGSLDCK